MKASRGRTEKAVCGMTRERSSEEIDELVRLALDFCELRQRHRDAASAGDAETELDLHGRLARLDRRIALLKSDDELDRQRARKRAHVIVMAHPRRKTVYER